MLSSVLDFIVSSDFWLFSLVFLLFALGYLLAKYWDTWRFRGLKIFLAVFFPLLLMLFLLLLRASGYYGYAENLTEIRIVSNKLCVTDEQTRKTKFSDVYKICRLYVLNAETGQIIRRKYLDMNAIVRNIEGNEMTYKREGGWIRYNIETDEVEDDSVKIYNRPNQNLSSCYTDKYTVSGTENTFLIQDSIGSQFEIEFETASFSSKSECSKPIIFGNNLYFNIETTVVCVDVLAKKLVWTKKL